jgi:peptidoglycan/xylan/chitin deacetylase (PgdA/CDA1 family)
MIVPVFEYHRVCSEQEFARSPWIVAARTFRSHLRYLKSRNCYTPGILDILYPGPATPRRPGRPILLTFDDGYADTLDVALPIMREFGFSAIVSVLATFDHLHNWWDDEEEILHADLLRPEQVLKLSAAGVEVASHTLTHPHLPRISPDELRHELTRSKQALEELLGKEVPVFTYPYGETNALVKSAAREAGYRCALAAYTGPICLRDDPFEIRRILVSENAGPLFLESALRGIQNVRGWLVRRTRDRLHLLRS